MSYPMPTSERKRNAGEKGNVGECRDQRDQEMRARDDRSRRIAARRDDRPLPPPILIDIERDLWRAGLREWDAEGREVRIEGETCTGMAAAWARSREMVAERKRSAMREALKRPSRACSRAGAHRHAPLTPCRSTTGPARSSPCTAPGLPSRIRVSPARLAGP
jgi:hypothetical protein